MGYGVKLLVKGDYACFTRPEMKVERVSYDVMTPSAARGIVEAIYWKPAIKWVIDKIHILNKIEFTNIRKNELANKIPRVSIDKIMKDGNISLQQLITKDRQQRASLILKDVAYVIEAHFELTKKATTEDTVEKHYCIAKRRMEKGQCYRQPYLGTREFSANFEWIEENNIPKSYYNGKTLDLHWMLYDIDFENNMEAKFFRAEMIDGIVNTEVKI